MVQGMGLGDNTPKKDNKKKERKVNQQPQKQRVDLQGKKARSNVKQKPIKTQKSDKNKLLIAIPLMAISLIILYIGINYKTIRENDVSDNPVEDVTVEDENTQIGVESEYDADDEVYASDNEILALDSAANHIMHNPYSLSGLRKQLQQEGYSPKAVEYAVVEIDTKSGVDWNANAVKAAERYIAYAMPEVSVKLLKEQLVYEGFTGEEVAYAVENVDTSDFKADDEIPDTYLPGEGDHEIEQPESQPESDEVEE